MEIRWHARAGQGAKTASQVLATALLRSGRHVQAFPEYGPERGGAPIRAYTRYDRRPIRRRHGITEPDVVVVIEPTLIGEVNVTEGLADDGLLLINGPEPLPLASNVLAVDAGSLADPRYVNMVLLGALVSALGEPPLAAVQTAAREQFSSRLAIGALAELQHAIGAGFDAIAAVKEVTR
jgi:pyruvate ferredoxin oxidoreductase gamma subunit